MELCRLRPDDLPNHFARNTQIATDRLDRHLSRKIRQADFGDRLHNQHLELGPLRDQEAYVDPYPRGPDWMPITPKMGSLFHADSHAGFCARLRMGLARMYPAHHGQMLYSVMLNVSRAEMCAHCAGQSLRWP